MKTVSLVSDKEKQELIALGKGEELAYNTTETFVDLFKKQASLYPDSIAVVDEFDSIIYSELDRKSDILASVLVEKGVKENDFIALMFPRTKEFVISLLAVLKAGCAYIPMESDYPDDRLKYMIEDSEVKTVITTSTLFEKKRDIISLDNTLLFDKLDFNCSVTPINLGRPDTLAYMFYTSGSTGMPKGVMVSHAALKSIIVQYSHVEGHQPGDRCAESVPFSFIMSVSDIIISLSNGCTLHILPSSLRTDIEAFYCYLNENKIDIFHTGTPIGIELLNKYKLNVKCMLVGGDKMENVKNINGLVLNGLGTTETNFITYKKIEAGCKYSNVPIGRPLPNNHILLLDEYGELVPRGEAGEICIITPSMTEGYWNRAELNAEKFTECLFLKGKRMYHSGDMARWNNDGDLEYLGRIDLQVKLRGVKIGLREVEYAISSFQGINKAFATLKDINGEPHLCGYYISDENIEDSELRAYLSQSLTAQMIPSFFTKMVKMPLNPNGKVDRKALPIPELKAEEIVAPKSEQEKALFNVTSAQLGTEAFGITTNLLSMGLTSLGAIKLSQTIQQRLGLTLKASDILQNPSICKWKKFINTKEEEAKAYNKQNYYPLTENQLGIYIDWEQHQDSLQYNVPMALKFTGIDANRLKVCLKKIIEAHPLLKAHLEIIEGEIVQVRRDEATLSVKMEELTASPSDNFIQSRLRPFNLLGKDLCRMELYTYRDETCLFIDIHHIIYDGGSMNVLINDLQRIYKGEEVRAERFTAFDYALYYKNWKHSEAFAQTEAYFDNLIGDAKSVPYPLSDITDAEKHQRAKELTVSVERPDIMAFCRKLGITESSYFIGCTMEVLHRITREKELVVTTVSNGRSLSALSHTLGMFVQTLPVVGHSGKRTVHEALHTMHSQLLSTIENDKYPFTKLAERKGIKPNVLIAYQGDVLGNSISLDGILAEEKPVRLDTVKTPISLNIIPKGEECYNLVVEYDGSIYSESDMAMFGKSIETFARVLSKSDVDKEITKVSMIAEEEMRELITLGKGEVLEYDTTETFVDLFKKQALLYPNSIAVVDEVGSISYSELDKQSDVLASALIRQGVEADSYVGIMLPRRKEFLIALLSVFKSGGAYIPLDSEYPNDRLLYMLEDSQAKLLITTRELFDEKSHEGEFKADKILFIDELDFTVKTEDVNNSKPGSLAYMIYTSGSTGKPKGVMIEHKGLMNFITWLSQLEELTHKDSCALHTSFSFDGSMFDLFPPLAVGASLHVLSSSLRQDMGGLFDYIKKNQITGMLLTTQLGMAVMEQYDLPMRYLMVGGEKLSSVRPTSVKLYNCYGPTEFTVCSSYHLVNQNKEYTNIPIGKSIPNSLSVIVDTNGNLQPKGVAGELCLIGNQIARGYWGREELTTEKFTDSPFMEGVKMYHTGDLARWNAEGELEYLGRIDNQVKLRGFRIEIGEIESRLNSFDGVMSSCILMDKRGNIDYLIGYYCANEKIDTEQVSQYLASSLPDYMVPQLIVQIDEMPMTPNGKIDRKALQSRNDGANMGKLEMIPPGNSKEKLLFNIVKEILGAEEFGVTDNLTYIGLTSLAAIKLVAKADQKGLKLKVNDIFRLKNIRSISSSEMSMGYWVNGFNTDKPVAVVISGVSGYEQLRPLVDKLASQYSVFEFEPLQDHFDYIFKGETKTEVVNMYTMFMSCFIPEDVKVSALIGHSYGGELAYRSAIEWETMTGQNPYVYMFDTYSIFGHSTTRRTGHVFNKQTELSQEEEKIKEIIHSLDDGAAFPKYKGMVTLFSATHQNVVRESEDVERLFQQYRVENEDKWRSIVPQINVFGVDTSHEKIVTENLDTYLDIIQS